MENLHSIDHHDWKVKREQKQTSNIEFETFLNHPDVTYQQISDYIDVKDPRFDPPMKTGQPITSRSLKLGKHNRDSRKLLAVLTWDTTRKKEREQATLVREGNNITKQMSAHAKVGTTQVQIITDNQITVVSLIFPAELATTICRLRVMFSLCQGIAVPKS